MNLSKPEEMLLALLRAAIHQQEVDTVYFQQISEHDWLECYLLALHQGILSLAWEGVNRLQTKYYPPLNVKLSWALHVNEQIEKYREHCLAVNKLIKLLSQHGIATLVLKGVGLSRFYPVPAYREGGDVDIYTYSANNMLMTDEQASRLADEIVLKQGAVMDNSSSVKHSKFAIYGVTFENHKMFLREAECPTIIKADKWLQEHISTQKVELLGGECSINVPAIAFDSVFIPLHAAQHYGMGLSLKHLCDWSLFILQNGFLSLSEPNDKYFKQTIAVLTQLCNKYLGLAVSVDENSKLADEMMHEILHPPYYGKKVSGGVCKQYLFQLRNRIHIFKLKHRLLGVSFIGKVVGLCVRKIKEYTFMH